MNEMPTDGYEIDWDKSRLDIPVIHRFLSESYWSPGLPLDVLKRAINGSLCVGVYRGETQAGFARVVTDQATFAYLCDVFVLEEHRGRGLSKRLMEAVMSLPELQGLRRFTLVTRDAHGLYEPFGFQVAARPQGIMEILRPDVYLKAADDETAG